MVTTLSISSYIERIATLGQADTVELQNALQTSPWCATYRMLLARVYANENSYLKNKSLRLAATYAGKREQLFELVHSQELAVNNASVPLEEQPDNKQDTTYIETHTEQVTPPLEISDEEIAITKEVPKLASEEDKTTTIASEITPESSIEEILLVDSETKEIQTTEMNSTLTEIDIPIDLEVTAQTRETLESPKKAEKHTRSVDLDQVVTYDPLKELPLLDVAKDPLRTELSFDTVVYDPERELTRLITVKEEAQPHDEHDFLFWLNNIDQHDVPKKSTDVNYKSPDKVHDLLDQFLSTKRNRPIQKGEFFNAQNKAEESEKDNMDILSETLVDLYVKQGHLEKAILGFQKLSLQNPSKSTYFAARISEIQAQQIKS